MKTPSISTSLVCTVPYRCGVFFSWSSNMCPYTSSWSIAYLGREISGRLWAAATSDPNEMLTWAEPPYALLSCCSIIIFILGSCLSFLDWDESRKPKFRGRDRNHFWPSIPFLTLSTGKAKKEKSMLI